MRSRTENIGNSANVGHALLWFRQDGGSERFLQQWGGDKMADKCFKLPWPGFDETLTVFVAEPVNGSRYRVGWNLSDGFGYLDHGHISSHESAASAERKKAEVVAWLEVREASGTEAGTGETREAGLDPKDDGPAPKGDAQ